MKSKLIKVINSCTTLAQLQTANKYLYLCARVRPELEPYGELALYKRMEQIGCNAMRNINDYREYAQHLLNSGRITDMCVFNEYIEKEIKKIELT